MKFCDRNLPKRVPVSIAGTTHFREDVSPFRVDGFMGVSDAFEVAYQRLQEVRRTRDSQRARRASSVLAQVCRSGENIMPPMMEALDAEVTLGEIGYVYREASGDWTPPAIATG